MYDSMKVSALSLMPIKWDKPANADRLEDFFVRAARDAPRLIVAPEGALEGYVIADAIDFPETAEAVRGIAEPLDGPYVTRFRNLARSLRTCLCFGMAERVGDDVYNCAVVIGDDGEICGTYHKTQLAEGYHESWWFNRIGTTLRAIDTPIGRVGIVICNDRWNPLIARALVLDGARLLVIPSFGGKEKSQNVAVLARARENGVPIVEANVGMNLIISKGEIVAYKWGNDQITTAVVDLPVPPSPEAARAAEQAYLDRQRPEMVQRYRKTLEDLEKGVPIAGGRPRNRARRVKLAEQWMAHCVGSASPASCESRERNRPSPVSRPEKQRSRDRAQFSRARVDSTVTRNTAGNPQV